MANHHTDSLKKLDSDISAARVQTYIFFTVQAVACIWLLYEVIGDAYRWLRFGEHSTVRLSTYFSVPHTGWVGVNRIIFFVWNLPIAVTLFIAILILGFCGTAKTQELRELRGKRVAPTLDRANG